MELPQEELDFQQPKTADLSFLRTAMPPDGIDDESSEFDPEELEFPPRSKSPAGPTIDLSGRLITAADLASQSSSGNTDRANAAATIEIADATGNAPKMDQPTLQRVSPEVFHQGMVVRHPQYGLGKIVALSGNGIKRKATVLFATGAGEKRFLLIHSPLRPAST
jgi:DNA helicase-2/ATP-dependent DNA helicase PcrA